jgi:hypothetical protein
MRIEEAGYRPGKMIWSGRILTVVTALFLLFDGVMKIVKPPQVLEASVRLGYPLSALSGVGLALLACTAIYLIPRTSLVGAVLLTGYLGGAVASNVRAGSGWFETLFPVLFAALVWAGAGLRDRRVRDLLTGRGTAPAAEPLSATEQRVRSGAARTA